MFITKKRLTQAQAIFLHSHVNGAEYYGDLLPANPWIWPRGTWFQTRMVLKAEPIELGPAQVISLEERRGKLR